MQAWQATVQDDNGNVVVNPSITVYQADGVTLAQIYNQNETPKANPFIGTLEGFVQFFAPDGDYVILGTAGPNQTERWSVVINSTATAIAARNAAQGFANAASASAGQASTSAGLALTRANAALSEANRAKDEADRAAQQVVDFNAVVSTIKKPIVILAIGQSNMAGWPASNTGNKTSDPEVFFWNLPGEGQIGTGTQWRVGAFGTPPLTVESGGVYANSLALQAAKRVRARTGRPVYVIQVARGAHKIECWMSDAVLGANGWDRGTGLNLYSMMASNLAPALAAVPGAPTQVDAIFVHQGEANSTDLPDIYARKLKYAMQGIADLGYASLAETILVLGEVATRAQASVVHDRHRNGLLRFKDTYNFDLWRHTRIASSAGLPTVSVGNVHFEGQSLVSFGQRYADAMFNAQPEDELHPFTTDYSVDGSLRWCTGQPQTNTTDYFSRVPPPHDFLPVTPAVVTSIGPAYTVASGQEGAIGHRKVLRVPYSGVITIEYHVAWVSGASTPHRAFCWTWDGARVFQTATFAIPPSSPISSGDSAAFVTRTFKRNGSPAVADATLPANATYFSPGVYMGSSTGGSCAFNILSIRIV